MRGRDAHCEAATPDREYELSDRPPVTVIVPFAGTDEQLAELRTRLSALHLRPGDALIISDNRPDPIHTPAYARNQGARLARGEWLVFIDADTVPETGLLDAYFDRPPDPRCGVLAGWIDDAAARMSQRLSLERPGTPYAQTANCAIRRSAFEDVGGFEVTARAGEDADLCFRLQRAGWTIEQRPEAVVRHRSRESLAAWLGQLLRHGSGAAWIETRWPGELPATPPGKLTRRLARDAADAGAAIVRGRRRAARDAILDLLGASAFEVGRLLPNTRRDPD